MSGLLIAKSLSEVQNILGPLGTRAVELDVGRACHVQHRRGQRLDVDGAAGVLGHLSSTQPRFLGRYEHASWMARRRREVHRRQIAMEELAAEGAQRYGTAMEFAEALVAALNEPLSPAEPAPLKPRFSKRFLLVGGSAILLLVVFAAWMANQPPPPPPPRLRSAPVPDSPPLAGGRARRARAWAPATVRSTPGK